MHRITSPPPVPACQPVWPDPGRGARADGTAIRRSCAISGACGRRKGVWHPADRRCSPRPGLVAVPREALTPRTAAWLVLRRAEKRSAADEAMLADLRRHAPELDEAVALAEAFTGLIRDRAADRLDPWLQQAKASVVQQLCGFAKRLSADDDTVRAAVSLDWSNGQTEGQINRLKTLKRQMYGRAKFDLLERRFLLAA